MSQTIQSPRQFWFRRGAALALVMGSYFTVASALPFLSRLTGVGSTALAALVGATFIIGLLILRRRLWNQSIERMDDDVRGMALLKAGKLSEAEAVFEDLKRRSKRHPAHLLLASYNASIARMRMGQVREASIALGHLVQNDWLEHRIFRFVAPAVRINAVYSKVLLGDCAGQSQKLSTIEAQLPDAVSGSAIVARVCLELREQRFDKALDLLNSRWAEAEGIFPAHGIRVLRIFKAFALHQLRRAELEIEESLRAVMPFQTGEFDYLATEWSTLGEFLREREIIVAS